MLALINQSHNIVFLCMIIPAYIGAISIWFLIIRNILRRIDNIRKTHRQANFHPKLQRQSSASKELTTCCESSLIVALFGHFDFMDFIRLWAKTSMGRIATNLGLWTYLTVYFDLTSVMVKGGQTQPQHCCVSRSKAQDVAAPIYSRMKRKREPTQPVIVEASAAPESSSIASRAKYDKAELDTILYLHGLDHRCGNEKGLKETCAALARVNGRVVTWGSDWLTQTLADFESEMGHPPEPFADAQVWEELCKKHQREREEREVERKAAAAQSMAEFNKRFAAIGGDLVTYPSRSASSSGSESPQESPQASRSPSPESFRQPATMADAMSLVEAFAQAQGVLTEQRLDGSKVLRLIPGNKTAALEVEKKLQEIGRLPNMEILAIKVEEKQSKQIVYLKMQSRHARRSAAKIFKSTAKLLISYDKGHGQFIDYK